MMNGFRLSFRAQSIATVGISFHFPHSPKTAPIIVFDCSLTGCRRFIVRADDVLQIGSMQFAYHYFASFTKPFPFSVAWSLLGEVNTFARDKQLGWN